MNNKELPKLPHGQGSFSHYRDKIRFQKNITVASKTFRISVCGDSVKECLSLMSEKEKEEEKRLKREFKHSLNDRTVTLTDAMFDWLGIFRGTIKDNSYDRLESVIKNQIAGSQIGNNRVIDITSKDIDLYFKNISTYSFSTIKKTYELLNRFMKYYYSTDISSNPMNDVVKPKPKKNVGTITIDQTLQNIRLEDLVLSDDEIAIFANHCLKESDNGSLGGSKYNPALYFILLTFLRVGEAVTLVWDDINFDKRSLRVNKSTSRVVDREKVSDTKTITIITEPKTKTSIRQVFLTDEAMKVLNILKDRSNFTDKRDFVICTSKGTQVSEQHLLSALKGTLKACGLNTCGERDKFGLHYLRHTGISYYLRHGVPIDVISEMAGHASTAITSEVYYHVINSQREEAAKIMNKIVKQNPTS